MGLNRNLLMNKKSMDIEASFTIGRYKTLYAEQYGYSKANNYGSISPSPLPNGVEIFLLYYSVRTDAFYITPNNVTVTINGIQLHNKDTNAAASDYLIKNVKKTIPVIFHFD